jgi:thioredoxin 1
VCAAAAAAAAAARRATHFFGPRPPVSRTQHRAMVEHVNSVEAFDKAVGGDYAVVDFYAEWCGPCKRIAPKIEELAAEHKSVKFVKVDVDKLEELAGKFGIEGMPTFKFFRKGKVVEALTVVGAADDKVKESLLKLKAMA